MKTTRFIFIILTLSLVSYPAFSQGLFNPDITRGAGWLSGQLPENTRFSLELGTGFSSFSSGTSMLGNYISPQLEYDLSPELTIIAGGSFSFNRYNNLPQSLVVNNNNISFQQGMTDHSLYAGGKYRFSDNLFLTGTVYRQQGHLPPLMMNRHVMDYKSQGMSMGLEYRITENLHFGAEVGVNRTNNPYHFYSPFSNTFGGRHYRSGNTFPPF